MSKIKFNVPSINQAVKNLQQGKLLPVYYLFGEDSYGIQSCLELIENKAKPFLVSDFDKEIFYGDDKSLSEVLDLASTFPFGSGKKLIILKEFEKIRDKKILSNYVKDPPDFTILVLLHNGNIVNLDTKFYKELITKNFIYTTNSVKGKNLIDWLINYSESKGKILNSENAQILLDIVGENRNSLKAQLEKIFTYLGETKKITLKNIRSLSTHLKEYSIFDLQSNIGKKDKAASLKIALELLEQGAEPVFIIYMLTRYFTGISRVNELIEKKIPNQAAAKIVGTHPYYYKEYLKARKLFSDKDLYNVFQALLKADVIIKTTSTDSKSVVSVLIAEILQ